MQQIVESDWGRGWIPSNCDKGEVFGSKELGLIRMDNVHLDERGNIRNAKGPTELSSQFSYPIKSIYSSNMNISAVNKKLRYVYTSNGTLVRNYGSAGEIDTFDKSVFTGSATSKCHFLSQLNHIFAIAGTKKYRDRGDVSAALGLPAPTLPTVVANAAVNLNYDNLDASDYFTNWASVKSTAFVNTGKYLKVTSWTDTLGLEHIGIAQTTFSTTKDTTNLGGTGNATDNDLVSFDFLIDDPTQLVKLRLEFIMDTITGSTTVPDTLNSYWFEWDFQNIVSTQLVKRSGTVDLGVLGTGSPMSAVNTGKSTGLYDWILQAGPDNWTHVNVARSQFNRTGSDTTKDWSNVKCIRLSFSVLGKVNGSGVEVETAMTFTNFKIYGGKTSSLTGDFQYVAVQVRDTGGYLEFSPHSTATAIKSLVMQNTTITPAGAVNAQANQYWVFRIDNSTGIYYLVNIQTGADGFTPIAFTDTLSVEAMLLQAAVNPQYTLEYYRTALPDDIIDMIWFQDRVIYLTPSGFIPSFYLDPGSYDSRFKYELCGTDAEQCLFIAKIDVGTFIVATTKDFYRVTGDFSKINVNGVSTLNVDIRAMSITDPAISSEYLEKDGSIIYLSSTGLRSLDVSTSTLINGPLDLLFRGETRYGIYPVSILPADQMVFSCATQGTRLYFSLPLLDGTNKLFVNTYQEGNGYWRLLDYGDNPQCIFREEDGTIIYGSDTKYLKSLETAAVAVPVYIRTQLNFNRQPSNRKDGLLLRFVGDTGNVALTLVIRGLKHDGTEITYTSTLTLDDNAVDIDLKAIMIPCLAYAVEIYGDTTTFMLDHFLINYEARPPLTRRVILFGSNFKKANKKKFSNWPVLVDPLGATLTIAVKADNIQQPNETATGTGIQTVYWYNRTDVAATDWEMEITGSGDFEHYEWMTPDLIQVFPNDRLWDQIGPVDFNKNGLVYGLRLRLYCTTTSLRYRVYEEDTEVLDSSITTTINKDNVYYLTFPKGIDPSVCRVVLTASAVFNRFSAEFKVRITGNESEAQFVKIK